jgi:hypothetical protein
MCRIFLNNKKEDFMKTKIKIHTKELSTVHIGMHIQKSRGEGWEETWTVVILSVGFTASKVAIN